ncbi:LacI family DNA-binding transcriptional regulator [Arcticibacter eurypsychrophilus]|uniref:LacI family DNA-binding transcriptional regulator n=1 Tax=Arcticibacter eurypsychrophilus TaxID=1434752 RepID=UPI00084DD381|nr:LacI family DNA-binding transcriptional regulator [Arcticibacter eurypsychrophilus]
MSQDKIITIYDIAEKLKLSPSTISRGLQNNTAVNAKTKKKIFDTANEMGYRFNTFARNLRTQNTNTIGVIVPRLNSYFISAVLAGIEKVINGAGYNMLISQSLESSEKEVEYTKTMMHNRVDGLIVTLAADTTNFDHFLPFVKHHIPLLFVDRVIDDENYSKVVIDNSKSGYDATTHLIDQGCKRIVHITGNTLRNVYRDRKLGYEKALIDHGIPVDHELLFETDLTEVSALKSVVKILKMNPLPDGLFVSNDFCAAICLKKLKQAGIKIPEDMAIVGFNNDTTSRITDPALSTINYPGQEMGEAVATNLINCLSNKDISAKAQTIVLKSELIVRESSFRREHKPIKL